MCQPRPLVGSRVRQAALTGLAGIAALLILPLAAAAQTVPPAYSADVMYRAPDGSESTGKVVKSGADMRLEFTQAGRDVVQIIRRSEGVMYVLDAPSKTWFQVRGTPEANAAANGYAPPCDQDAPGTVCQFLGNETTSGITAEIWELGLPNQPTTRILWDGARHRALRQEFPDGSVMAMQFKAMEDIDGRPAEHWTIRVETPNQPPAIGNWFYDPELRVEVREELPGGELRSLENIVVGEIGPDVFTVPDGWAEVAPPQAPAPN